MSTGVTLTVLQLSLFLSVYLRSHLNAASASQPLKSTHLG